MVTTNDEPGSRSRRMTEDRGWSGFHGSRFDSGRDCRSITEQRETRELDCSRGEHWARGVSLIAGSVAGLRLMHL